jgi:CubicO group peptidase (beta-lactamase class C family)
MRTICFAAILIAACGARPAGQAPAAATDPWPKTVADFRTAVQTVLSETGVPGAGLALVRLNGVEWAGGVGLADRENNLPVTADTHFRVGSISKSFVAAAIVQMYLDDEIDLDTPVAELDSEIRIDNAWEPTDPVRVIHLLQHTAGFDDQRFNEMFNLSDPPDLPLADVLKKNPGSRVVRWRPGTRFSYSNPGYAILGHLIERVTGESYEDRIAERIFKPANMPTSSFVLTREDEAIMAKGYGDRSGPPLPYTPIYLRPAGNMHSSALEMGRWVHLLLNWGETETELVIDPEYLSNMEHPRTTVASLAGLRNGYGSGIASFEDEGFPMLGHNGGIEGFSAWYGYSTSRDAGYVILLNSRHAPDAMRRIRTLAVRYLKADVEPPPQAVAAVPDATLRRYEGYYHDANPRHQAFAFVHWLLAGSTVRVNGDRLEMKPAFQPAAALIPVSDTMFRLDGEVEASRVFVESDNGGMVMTGGYVYAERQPRWRIESVRWTVLVAAALVLSPLLMAIPWAFAAVSRRGEPRGGGWTKVFLLLCAIAFAVPAIGLLDASAMELAARNVRTMAIFAGSVLLPAAAILAFMFALDAWRAGAGRWFRAYAITVAIAALIVSGYLSAWGMLAFRPWSF